MPSTYPGAIDTFTDPAGTSLLASGPDHAVDHTTLHSAIGTIQYTLGTNSGTAILKNFTAGKFAARTSGETFGTNTWIGGTIGTALIGTSTITGGTIGTALIGTSTITGGTIGTALIGTSTIQGGTANNQVVGTPLTTGGTLNAAVIGTPAITGGTITSTIIQTWDGWTQSADTWVFASASTFTISGVDRTTTYTKGTRLKFTNSGSKYAVVVTSSFSSNTTVTIAVNTDYTIANAAISAAFYSYETNPQGYPMWFNYTSTYGGFSANPAGTWKFNITGNIEYISFLDGAAGTSNATTFTFTVPVAPLKSLNNSGLCFVKDNGTNIAGPGYIETTAASTTISVWKSFYQGAFTGSGDKQVYLGNVWFEI